MIVFFCNPFWHFPCITLSIYIIDVVDGNKPSWIKHAQRTNILHTYINS